MQNKRLLITAYPRIHITLIGMNNTGYRINGGLGFSVQDPSIKGNVCSSKKFSFVDERRKPFDKDEINRLQTIIDDIVVEREFSNNISVVISGSVDTHSGLGTGTAVRLLCLEALFIINNSQYTKKTIKEFSKRGGASGVGIRTYFKGGFIFDIGHRDDRITPSNIAELTPRKSLILKHTNMPNWKIGLCFPHFISSLTTEQEKIFFKQTVPISQNEINEVLYHSVYGVYGSIMDKNFESFYEAINNIQECKWKKSERDNYNEEIKTLETILYNAGAKCVGMSSMGPMLFFMGNDLTTIILNAQKVIDKDKCTFVQTKPNNIGRTIEEC